MSEHSRKKKWSRLKRKTINNSGVLKQKTLHEGESEKVTKDPDRDVFTKEAAIVDRLKQDFKGA